MADVVDHPAKNQISSKDYDSILNEFGRKKGTIDTARGDMADLKSRAEDKGIHWQAFKMAQKLAKMDQAVRDDFRRALNEYCAKQDLFAQGDMLEQAGG